MEPATTTSTRDADAVGSVCSASGRGWRTLNVIVRGAVGYLELAQPDSRNAFTAEMLQEIPHAVKELEEHPDGQGPDFCAGINLSSFGGLVQELLQPEGCPGRARFRFQQTIRSMQEALTVFESCRWPVIAAVQGNCIGGGVDLICCCDVRICTDSARFSVKEIDIAIAADLGSLQRLPRLIGHGRAAALALTGHSISAQDAMAMGLVSFCAPDSAALDAAAAQLADALAAKSPLALAATKRALLHSRDHPVPQGLEYVALLNSAVLPSHDVVATLQALRKRSAPPVAYPRL